MYNLSLIFKENLQAIEFNHHDIFIRQY